MNETNRRRILAGSCLIALAASFLSNLLFGFMSGPRTPSHSAVAAVGFLAVLNMGLMIGSIFGLTHLLRHTKHDRLALTGAALALLGWTASARIMVLVQFQTLLQIGVPGVSMESFGKIFQASPMLFLSIVPIGLLFPIGLILLGIALFRTDVISRWIGALLILGGILFPVGRAVRVLAAVYATDVVLAATFALIGWQILTRAELWTGSPAKRNESRAFPSGEMGEMASSAASCSSLS